jgi:hypothetical protein
MIKNKLVIIILGIAVGAAVVYFFQNKKETQQLSYQLFKTDKGWGYDILVNKTVYIHQDNVPVINRSKGFDTQQQAQQAAMLVINKVKVKKAPVLDKSEVENILLPETQVQP